MSDHHLPIHVEKIPIDRASSKEEEEVELTYLGRIRYDYREFIAEFWGTFILILFGDGVIAQTVLSSGAHGNQVTINLCWGIAVVIGVYVSGGISGAHLNPAVTLTLAIFRKFPMRKIFGYWIAQGAGAFLASAVLYADYIQAFNNIDGGTRYINTTTTTVVDTLTGIATNVTFNGTANIFSTYPAPFMTPEGAFFDEALGTAILLFGIFAINDMGNSGAGNLGPLMIGLLVMGLGMAFGWETGYALNPARDMGPRMFAYFIYGNGVFTAGSQYFVNYAWVPVLGPLFGGPLGAFLYDFFIYTGESPLQDLWHRS